MHRLAYILSASHSGSTLLAMVLGAQPGVCTAGELKLTHLGNPDRYRCSCKALIRDCAFWNAVKTAMAARGIADFELARAATSIYEVDGSCARRLLAPLVRGPFWETLRDAGLALAPRWRAYLKESQRRNAALVGSLQEITGARIVVDSSKLALRLKYLLKNPDLDIKVIRLIRDGRAVAMTYTDEWMFADAADPALRGGGCGQRRASARSNMTDAANEWKRSNESADCLVDRLPAAQWIRVRYEDFCRDPKQVLTRLCEFLGLDSNHINLDFRAPQQHVVGNGMRLDESSKIKLDERWKEHLSKADLAAFDQVAGELNRKYGYN
ncbi:MAG: sulfotransferase [Verrucomicrobiota bacterium]|jgi:hypothetical protein